MRCQGNQARAAVDERYQQWDLSAVHAFQCRRIFIECIRYGEANADIGRAAIAVAAEDDAIGLALHW
jgi:hypothetical protein